MVARVGSSTVPGDGELSPDGRTLSTTLTVRNMSTKLAPGSTANEYYVYWDFGGKTYITNAEVSPSGTTFRDGTFDADGRNFRSGRPADTGKVVPGPNGTVTVNVPLSVIGSPRAGDILKAVNAESRALTAVIVLQYDSAGPKFDFQLGQLCT